VTPIDKAVLDLARLGLKGDAASVRRYARTLLKDLAKERGAEDPICKQLSHILAESTAAQQYVRETPTSSGASVSNDAAALLRFEEFDVLEAPVLSADVEAALRQLLVERERAGALRDAGLEPTRTLLMVGPPGVGKTMLARYCAAQLRLPMVAIDLGAVMSSYLGKSGQNLGEAIAYARSVNCVFLIDEFDAIAKRRDDPADVGELKRIVNLLLLELERWPATGLLIAATNHPELLDRAIWRRFDRVLEIGPPDVAARRVILARELTRFRSELTPAQLDFLAGMTEGASGSDLVRLVRAVVREAVLGDVSVADRLESEVILRMLKSDRDDEGARRRFCELAHDRLGWSQRQIATTLGVSHVTVGKILKQAAQSAPPTKRARG
jgi:SpoVK/Ycf46/Vps4 family AAA+-type ATPase